MVRIIITIINKSVSRPHWNETGIEGYMNARMNTNIYENTDTSSHVYAYTGDSVFGDVSMYSYTLEKAEDLPGVLTTQTGPQ